MAIGELSVQELKDQIAQFPDDFVVMCGFCGLAFYKPMGAGKHDFAGKIDFGAVEANLHYVPELKKEEKNG